MRQSLSRRAFAATAVAGTFATAFPGRALHAQSATPVSTSLIQAAIEKLPAVVNGMHVTSGVPGVAVAVVHADEAVYLEGFGEREVGTGSAVGPDTVFQIASLSKPVSSTIVAAVVGNGELAWDTKMADILPDFRLIDPWVTAHVTVADLFSHRSGLPDHVGDHLEDLGGTREQVLHALRYVELEGAFRDSYAYTNFGLTAAAEGVAEAMGMDWESLGEELLFAPAGMMQTSFRHSDFVARADRALGHVQQEGAWVQAYDRQPDAQSAAGGVSSSVRDLAQWMRLQLQNGELDGVEIVDAAALGETHLPHAVSNMSEPPHSQMPGFYGLGWNVGFDASKTVTLSHSGAFAYGAATAVYLWPAENLGIVVLTNGAPVGLAESICLSFHDLARTGEVAMDYLTPLGEYMASEMVPKFGADVVEVPANPEPPRDLDTYIGGYINDVFGEMNISLNGSDLAMTLGPQQMEFALVHFNRDVFTYEPVGENAGRASAVTFTIAADGMPAQVVIENLDLYHAGTFMRT